MRLMGDDWSGRRNSDAGRVNEEAAKGVYLRRRRHSQIETRGKHVIPRAVDREVFDHRPIV